MRSREDIRAILTDHQALVCTLIGEAMSEPLDGVLAVASTIRNRVRADLKGDAKPDWWGEGYRGVCLKTWQFSCWWEDNANSTRVYDIAGALLDGQVRGPVVTSFEVLAQLVIDGHIPDLANGADHYLTTALLRTVHAPAWAKTATPILRAGGHSFFRLN